MTTAQRLSTLVTLTGLLIACSETGAPTTRSQVTLRVASRPATGAPVASLVGETDTIASPEDTIVLDQVQIVLRDVRFKRIDDDACEGEIDDTAGADTADAEFGVLNSDDGQEEACEEVNVGPFLLDVPLTPGTEKQFTVLLDTGTFDEVRFKIHKPTPDVGDPKDVQFLLDHPEFSRISIRATGTFNGAPFEFTSDINQEQRSDLVPPLSVAGSPQDVTVTLLVELDSWFRTETGGLVDPASAIKGGPNDQLVKKNILNSFRAFRDDNGNGEDDDGGED